LTKTGEVAARRREQQVKWLWSMLEERMFAKLRSDPAMRARLRQAETAVAEGKLSATLAVEQIVAALGF
jgi:LAO/AO transport system kinase